MTISVVDDLVKLTCDLIRIRSTEDRPEQLAAVIDYAAEYLAAVRNVNLHRSEQEGKPALIATLHNTTTPTLMLNAHLDVVAARTEQFEPEVRGGRIYGRGSQDMKGSGTVLLRLLRDLAALPARPNVGVQFVTDEEIGGFHGTARLVDEGWRCAFFIALEPTDLNICYAHKGGMVLDVLCSGAPAHGAKPWEGANPLTTLGQGLSRLEQRFPSPSMPAWITTVTPTAIHGGTGSRNQIPPEAVLTLDIRYIPDDHPSTIAAEVEACFPGGKLSYLHTPPLATDPQHPMITRLATLLEHVRGTAPVLFREHFCTDARFYGAAGIPAICVGPIGAGLHSDEEWVDIASLQQLHSVLYQFCLET